ncbi:MAG: DISARM system SNF2-like helicase DrmD [Myxococcales bacterium]|nr:DISARM system SNF2-like helicase DrmD [Myxococcales bacterium]
MHVQPPEPGQIVALRRRHWLVHETQPGRGHGDATVVRLHCIDDDAAGEHLEVLWELELGPRILHEDKPQLGEGLDEPRLFGAYLNTLRWNCVSSTDKELLQAPFRAGIDIKAYQLEPLRKALELPRVNMFIADDVGLGKTIEAGLILQELLLRQRIDRVLVVCPPAVTLQWKEELEQRFGLSFALYDREFVAARRRERGWSINPWRTHARFVVSYAMLRGGRSSGPARTQHLDLLLSALPSRLPRSLLILDEAHHVAPSGDSVYAIDSRTTAAIRQLAHRFEHRLFLSATPHNGHSNSFSTLLHLLDPQRFTPGVTVSGVDELDPIMVRRLKRDLRGEVGDLPERKLVDHVIRLPADAAEVQIGKLLEEYETLNGESLKGLPTREREARKLICINLHKRLLSSVAAFHRTLEQHARGVEAALARGPAQQTLVVPPVPKRDDPDEERGDEALDADEDEWVRVASVAPHERAAEVLRRMREIATAHKDRPDTRLRELARWIRENLCPEGRWNARRVVVFTEYDDTLRWMLRLLPDLIGGDCDGRIGRYTGGLSDKSREELKKAFNTDPAAQPLRVLLATDAAREGINLQAHCADLFHFDLPWNPSRVEQRNGRIDRTLQPADVVRCHYFDLPDRPEDRVLTYMVRKIATITEELGSLSDVLSERIARRMEQGIRGLSRKDIDELSTPDARAREAVAVLEAKGSGVSGSLQGDLAELDRLRQRSEKSLGYRTDHLRQAVDLAVRLSASDHGLEPVAPPTDPPSWRLPDLDESWNGILDGMRADTPADGWRRQGPVKPVTFTAAHRLDADTVQLHLGHPLVKRLLARFLAQGFGHHDLSRCTVIAAPGERLRRVVAFGRLVLFGDRAGRLHESLVEVAANVRPDGSLEVFRERGTTTTLASLADRLADGPLLHPDRAVQAEVRRRASADFERLWTEVRARAEAEEAEARSALEARGAEEADALRAILDRQERAIHRTIDDAQQYRLRFAPRDKAELEQFERDGSAMRARLGQIAEERAAEPEVLRRAYDVRLRRIEPVGLVYLWPEGA